MQTSVNFVVFCALFSSVTCGSGYYWRDWNGTIPSDAYVVANDSKGPVYFAQAYLYNTGLFVGNIKKQQFSIPLNPTTSNGPVKYSSVLKIFCASPDTLMWFPSNTTVTPKLERFVQPVLGGITNSNKTVYVGRFTTDGLTYVGSIHTDYYLYYTKQTGDGGYVNKYEILIHELGSNC
nr:uncharacterized protein LOC111508817 [Leptinotarsa decemlineata]